MLPINSLSHASLLQDHLHTLMATLSPFFSSCTLPNKNSLVQHKISCKASHDDEHPMDNKSLAGRHLDRRNVLLRLGSAAAGLTMVDYNAFAQPIVAPDLSKCGPADLPTGSDPNCCPPYQPTILDFKPPPPGTPLRIRRAAQLVTPEYKAKYAKAVELMKALPADDPRSFMQQANVHCAYCDAAYDQVGFPNLELQVHNSWLFFPWHRYYLHFHERILGKLIGDETFALPFWY